MNISFLEDREQFASWYERMPEYRKKKVDAYKPQRSKQLSLGAGILLNRALEDIGITDYEVELGEREKPHIKGRDDVFFNISHSKDVVILGISDHEIGVDVEKTKHFKDSLINYVFGPSDLDVAKELSDDRDISFTRLWTVKESIMKHSGKGIALEPKGISLRLEEGKIKASSAGYDCEALNLISFEIPDYQITVCSEYSDFVMIRV